ncbi:MAG: cation transporter [Bacteroidetes bacterium]|nr:MAG: cation transporter [Bacteroidota bacterium]TAG86256.1 MAG: cation transporter [Bacteroidota bacterium]
MPKKLKIILAQTLIVSVILMIIKFWAYFITNSNAILTDASESIINVIAGSFALFSLHLANVPKDENHPYGHGKIEFLSVGFEGGLIVLAGVVMIIKSTYSFIYPHTIDELLLGIILTAVSTLVNFFIGYYLILIGKKQRSMTMQADGHHLQSDAYSSFGLLLGLLVIQITNIFWLDSVLAALFAVFIIFTGIALVRKATAGIMDEANAPLLSEVVEILNKNREISWIDIHNLRIIQYGQHLHIDAHLTLPYYWDLEKSHNEVKKLEDIMLEKHPQTSEMFIHADPCLPTSCAICQIENCAVRVHKFVQKIEWSMDSIVKNQKHQV